ncbi:hypothetical protein [Deinococcus irradiatisoli]|nr:hypothetical protein [Deinococcus irradiatisoli]
MPSEDYEWFDVNQIDATAMLGERLSEHGCSVNAFPFLMKLS